MKNCFSIIVVIILLQINLQAQEHLSGTTSLSTGFITAVNTRARGVNFNAHYHLNGYDEIRLGAYLKKEQLGKQGRGLADAENTVQVKTRLLSLDFAKGLKIRSKTNVYFGAGLSGGYEQLEDNHSQTERIESFAVNNVNGLLGFRLYTEFELVLTNNFSLSARAGQQFLFSGIGVLRYEFIFGTRYYW